MNALRSTSYYDEHAQTVNLYDITSSDNNANVLRMLRDNDPELTRLLITQDQHYLENAGSDYPIFVVQEGDDLGWLGYFIGRNKKLRSLRINDLPEYREQITALLRGIEQNRSIRNLCIYGDHLSGGESVLNSLSALLRSESCCLTLLELDYIPLGDDVAVALADALKGNKSLKDLYFDPAALTSVGWSAFSKLLCDTSSVSNIYASNHTLQKIGYGSYNRSNYPQAREVEQLLALNELTDKYAAIEKRQLSTIYNVVRGMPLVAIDGCRRYSVGQELQLQEPKVGRHKYRRYLLGVGRTFIVMCTLLLLCLLILRLPTRGDFIAALSTLCVLLLQVVSVYS